MQNRNYRIISKLTSILVTLFAIALAIILILPFFWIITSAIRPYGSLYTTEFELIPKNANLNAFKWVISESKFWIYAKNSLITYSIALFFSLLVTIPAAYGFSRFNFRGKKPILNSYFILAQFMGGMSVIGLIGLYIFIVKIKMIDSQIIVGLIYAANTVPYVTWYLKTYFDSIPREFDEAAFLDGASFLQNLFYVILPIAKPGIFVAVIFISLMTWSEWVIAGLLLSQDKFTLSVALVTLQGRWETPWNRFAAMSILYCIPILILFFFSNKYMREGLTLGGLKE